MEPNVCVVVLDAVRASNLSCYGHSRLTSPNIDAVADESMIFDYAVSPAATTLDSVSSLFSGLYPAEHQAGYNGSLSVNVPHLPELFSDAGYRTGAITTNPFITPGFGFEQGVNEFFSAEYRFQRGTNARKFFDSTKHLPTYQIYLRFILTALGRHFLSSIGNALQFRFDLFTRDDQGAKQASSNATEFFNRGDKPWFLYLHYSEAHMKDTEHLYKLPGKQLYKFVDEETVDSTALRRSGDGEYPEEAQGVHERLYDATIRYLDHHVGKLVSELKRTEQWEETLFIITADHGECLGRNGHIGHGTLYEPGIHVPLLIKLPADMSSNAPNEQERVNTLGLYSMLADLIGSNQSHTTVPPILDGEEDHVLVQDFCANWDWSSYADEESPGQHAIYKNELKLIQRGEQRECYNIEIDPAESEQLSTDENRVQSVGELLSEKLQQQQPVYNRGSDFNIDESTADRLEDLGYL
ncbi:sulfatase [Haloarcula sp. 1CSR25-25]|uniref:sulfatase n=1 Tax=Haloarcula sp. 1CSR25-25 TaxID=2862545 RepID=UPI002894D513|nr:sulfatase [Haloarcula sp. 1CSR25-25]MDT3435472.1 sulfatase [Haloarcula sp. 1CSR25-25]